MKKTTLCNNRFAMILTMISLFFMFLALLTIIENEPEHSATYGFMMFSAIFGIPGFWLCYRGRRKQKNELLMEHLLGYFKSHDQFTITEMAKKVGKTEMETESLVFRLIDANKVDLVFHRKTRQYLHKNRIQKHYHQLSKCPSCNANLTQEIIFDGERVSCQYCGHQV